MLLSFKTHYLVGTRKLRIRYMGSFRVLECIGKTAYRLDLRGRFKSMYNVFHVSLLKKHIPRSSSTNPSEPIQIEGEEHFEVEALMQHKSRGNSQQYLIKWLGYGLEQDKWIHK